MIKSEMKIKKQRENEQNGEKMRENGIYFDFSTKKVLTCLNECYIIVKHFVKRPSPSARFNRVEKRGQMP